jgi:hypothetical protein
VEIRAGDAPLHTRTLTVRVARDAPGHLAVDGVVLDLRKRGLVPMGGDLQTAGVIHHMKVAARVETDGPSFAWIRAEQPTVAFEASPGTGGDCCRDPLRRIEALAGTPLDGGFPRRLGDAIGGPRGCSHVLTLAQLLGSTTTLALELERRAHGDRPERPEGQRIFQRSLSVDGATSGERSLAFAIQLADVHFTPAPPEAAPLERLAGQHEVRAEAEIDLGAMTLRGLRAAERWSGPDDLGTAEWRDRTASIAGLEGRSGLMSMARALFERLGARHEDRPLLDALLNLAPTAIQCFPALSDRWHASSGGARSVVATGGRMLDTCYMWRREGTLHGIVSGEFESRQRHAQGGVRPEAE